MSEYSGKYFFIQIVRTGESVASEMLGYDTERAAEIKFHDEVSYGLKNNDVIFAYYTVINEYGVKVGNLEKIIDNLPHDEEQATA